MGEHIYTIPVNEAFDDQSGECPLCLLYEKLQENELSLILGASLMEPEVRVQTNEKGFCRRHFDMLLSRKNRLGLALLLESHLEEVKKRAAPGGALQRDKTASPRKKLSELEKSCYICERVSRNFAAVLSTTAYLYEGDGTFRKKFAAAKCLCLPHYRSLLEETPHMHRPYGALLAADAAKIVETCLEKLKNDVSWFCKKFDYRYEDEPWHDAKDAPERAVKFLTSK